ncbi:MAG: hypothetical protein FJZ01_21460 [Candidatus Sericytochromatia bacterium]|nr:hypothetical protein [Candidatus Tanganyikabacteria bacterium]
MLHRALGQYPGLASAIEVKRFEHTATTYALVAIAKLRDGSILVIRDYLFADGTQKYAYHWQASDGALLGRWDNEAHWPEVATFPHHFHPSTGPVAAS